jgi:phosphoribosylglycinamide formyltransferase-1
VNDAKVVLVISNNPGAYALERAKQAGIEAVCVSPEGFATREDFNKALLSAVQEAQPDLIVLAGFLVAIPPEMIRSLSGPHHQHSPGAHPSFCGTGYLRAACA